MGSGKNKSMSTTAAGPHRQADELSSAKAAERHPPRTREATERLVHEFEVHQIELEMQNEELRQAHAELELSRNTYAELYDFAPIGYFIFDALGVIRKPKAANLSFI